MLYATGSHNRIEATEERNNQPTDQYDVLWKPFALDFYKSNFERQFQRRVWETRFSEDMVAHFVGMLVGPVFLSQLYTFLPGWYITLWILISFVYAPLNIYTLLRHRHMQNLSGSRIGLWC